jgi:hypothetical protein
MTVNKWKLVLNTGIAVSALYSGVLGVTNIWDMVLWNIIFTTPFIVFSADEK